MAKTVEVPVSLLTKLTQAAAALRDLEDDIEDYFLSRNPQLLARMRKARSAHKAGKVRPLADLKRELCIE